MQSATSPCVKGCGYDSARGICRGCGRTLDEIANWQSMSDDERRAVRVLLPARLMETKEIG